MANAKDYKKEFKDMYLPKTTPMLIDVPRIPFVAVEGKGDPNAPDGEYSRALALLYSVQYTIKMSKMGDAVLNGYFDYVVPPLEGFWWFENNEKIRPQNKSKYLWLSAIRLPEFVDKDIFKWACKEASAKKGIDTTKARLLTIKEGLCVQCMHLGSYDDEPATVQLIDNFIAEHNLIHNITDTRRHHEIYLKDPRKTEPAKLKTILRIPVKR